MLEASCYFMKRGHETLQYKGCILQQYRRWKNCIYSIYVSEEKDYKFSIYKRKKYSESFNIRILVES